MLILINHSITLNDCHIQNAHRWFNHDNIIGCMAMFKENIGWEEFALQYLYGGEPLNRQHTEDLISARDM